jgi:hypothetical protein
MLVIVIMLYTLFGFVCSLTGATYKTWQFWVLLGILALVDFISYYRAKKEE